MKKHLGMTSLLAGLFLSTAPAATRNWAGGNGEDLAWGTAANWSGNTLPSLPNDAAQFLNGANLSVLVPVGSSATTLITQENTTVTLKLSAPTLPDTATLTLTSFLDVGNSSSPTSTNPSHVTVTGDGGVLHTTALRVGVTSKLNGNQLTFTDGVIVTSALSNSGSAIGRYGFDNLLQVEKGANVTVDNLSISTEKGVGNNRLVITGTNSQFTVGGASTNRGLRVGTGTAGTSYADAMQNNYVHVSDGGKLSVTALISGSAPSVNIGGQTKAHDNYILVEGVNSVFELGKGASTSLGSTLQIGNGADYGGNYVEIRDGGSLVSGTGHTGAITIYGHDKSDPAAQRSNRLTVGEDGTVSVGGAINVTGGLLQLSSKGSLTAASITVGAGGRFEAAGDDFRTTGTAKTTIQNLGTLAVQEETLSLRTGVKLDDGATLELHLLDEQTVAGLEFLSGGTLTIGATTKLHLVADETVTLQLGATWQLFKGDTLNHITGTFNFTLADLPTLDQGLLWDFSAFNQNGGWTVTVIPEPESVALLCAGFVLLALRAFPRKQQICVS